jgi:alginate O-acetyltransferase complex protein AlgJ
MSNYTKVIAALVLGGVCAGCGVKHVEFPWPLPAEEKAAAAAPAEVQTIGPKYDRTRSRVLVRQVLRPTRANLDYAAYHQNVVTYSPGGEEPVGPAAAVPPEAEVFGGVLVPGSIRSSMARTPLTDAEKARPMAFSPLVDVLSQWNYEKASPLDDARAAVRAESWGRKKSIQVTFQEITELYLHEDRELWVRIEFQEWARLFENMPDEDGDGFSEIYAQLKPELVAPEVLDYIRDAYAKKLLDRQGVKAWANELASYWYPSYNTDIFDMGKNTSWPVKDTEPEVVKELGGFSVDNPAVVIRGKPHGKAIYNLFIVEGLAAEVVEKPKEKPLAEVLKKHPVTTILKPQAARLKSELEKHESWEVWARSLKVFHKQIRRKLKKRPKKLRTLIGRDGFLFYRNSMEYVVGGDLQKQPKQKNPFPVIVEFKDFLKEQGVDFLVVPVPTKVEVFPDKLLSGKLDVQELPVLNPYGRKLFLELAQAGVEVVDLLPAFLEARAERKPEDELLYQPQDTHWTDRGLRLAAKIIADRIKKYPWYADLSSLAVEFSVEKVVFKLRGDLVSRLAPKEQPKYQPDTRVGHKVKLPDGTLYEDDLESPIVLLGDSFTGVFQRTPCRNAGVSAHIAQRIRYPLDLVMSYGGGPGVRKVLLRRGVDDLKKRRLVIWLFTARDMYNYWEDWEPLKK